MELSARASENYGTTRDVDMIRYESSRNDPMDADEGLSVNSRYLSSSSPSASNANTLNNAAAHMPIDGSVFDGADESLTNGFMELWDVLAKTGNADNVLASIVRVYYGTPTNWLNVKALLDNNVVIPFTVLVPRPLIVLHTYSVCKHSGHSFAFAV